jgi:hypothetical protein
MSPIIAAAVPTLSFSSFAILRYITLRFLRHLEAVVLFELWNVLQAVH